MDTPGSSPRAAPRFGPSLFLLFLGASARFLFGVRYHKTAGRFISGVKVASTSRRPSSLLRLSARERDPRARAPRSLRSAFPLSLFFLRLLSLPASRSREGRKNARVTFIHPTERYDVIISLRGRDARERASEQACTPPALLIGLSARTRTRVRVQIERNLNPATRTPLFWHLLDVFPKFAVPRQFPRVSSRSHKFSVRTTDAQSSRFYVMYRSSDNKKERA